MRGCLHTSKEKNHPFQEGVLPNLKGFEQNSLHLGPSLELPLGLSLGVPFGPSFWLSKIVTV
jgi:hypothetical protein